MTSSRDVIYYSDAGIRTRLAILTIQYIIICIIYRAVYQHAIQSTGIQERERGYFLFYCHITPPALFSFLSLLSACLLPRRSRRCVLTRECRCPRSHVNTNPDRTRSGATEFLNSMLPSINNVHICICIQYYTYYIPRVCSIVARII